MYVFKPETFEWHAGATLATWAMTLVIRRAQAPSSLRWFWALHAPSKPGEMRTSNQVATMDEAKAELEASWKRWKAWAKMEEMP